MCNELASQQTVSRGQEKYPSFPRWRTQDEASSLDEIFKWVVAHTEQNIDWYNKRRTSMKWWAQLFRTLAIIGGVIGGLCPLLATAIGKDYSMFGYVLTTELSTWGYVFIALAAAFVSTDKLYGFSKAWIRYAKTQLDIQATLNGFYMEWAALESVTGLEINKKIDRLKQHVVNVEALIKKETDQWVVEFNTSIAELEGQLKGADGVKGNGDQKK